MRKRFLSVMAAILLLTGMVGVSEATLTTIGTATYGGSDYNLIYDADSPFGPITWLDYCNSRNNWWNQVDWAAGLNGLGVITYNLNPGETMNWTGNWRLPATVDGGYVFGYDGTTTAGYNIASSEMGHLYYEELENLGFYDTNGNYVGDGNYGLNNTGDFDNLDNLYVHTYWSGTEYAEEPSIAWAFLTNLGEQGGYYKDDTIPYGIAAYGIAVRSGQVSAVPVPGAIWLLGSGLTGLIALSRRRKGNSVLDRGTPIDHT